MFYDIASEILLVVVVFIVVIVVVVVAVYLESMFSRCQ